MKEKVFTTLDEQIDLLICRGICISCAEQRASAKIILEKRGYYNLINGYNDLFLVDGDPTRFKPGTTVQEIDALYRFDKKLRNLFFKFILEVETHIKSLISYAFSEVHGHKNYLTYSNFDTGKKNSSSNITALIAEVQKQIAAHSLDPSIQHYLQMHGYIPLWVLTNVLTLGTVSKFYSLMKQPERQAVAKNFNVLDDQLESYLSYISKIRNFCAHGNRLYCYTSRTAIKDTEYHDQLSIMRNTANEFIYGRKDLFACLIALRFLLSDSEFRAMCNELNRAMKDLKKRLNVITIKDVQARMGFPDNWMNLNRKIK